MQYGQRTRKGKASDRISQQVNALRLRVYQAKAGFMALGTDIYMPYLTAQATREGIVLSVDEKLDLRQRMNGRFDEGRIEAQTKQVEFIERALATQQAA